MYYCVAESCLIGTATESQLIVSSINGLPISNIKFNGRTISLCVDDDVNLLTNSLVIAEILAAGPAVDVNVSQQCYQMVNN